MDKTKTWLVIGLVIGIAAGSAIGFFAATKFYRPGFANRGTFQIDDSAKSEITSFFNSNPDSASVQSYCAQNAMNCAYYCRSINPASEVCKEVGNFTRSPGGAQPQWNQ